MRLGDLGLSCDCVGEKGEEGEPGIANECQLLNPPFYQCCCVCFSHVQIFTDNIDATGKWICSLPIDMGERFVIECEEHSCGCECWDDIRKKEKP